MYRSTKDVLKASREVIEDPEHWIKGKYYNAAETRFCAAGAIKKIDGLNEQKAKVALAKAIVEKFPQVVAKMRRVQAAMRFSKYSATQVATNSPEMIITTFNDKKDRTHGEILEAFDAAIESLK